MKNQTKEELRGIFNQYDIGGIPIQKDTNWDEYNPEIEQLELHLKRIKNVTDLENMLVMIFDKMFWKGISKKKDMNKIANEVFRVLKENNEI